MRKLLQRIGELFAEDMARSLYAQHQGVRQYEPHVGRLTSEDK